MTFIQHIFFAFLFIGFFSCRNYFAEQKSTQDKLSISHDLTRLLTKSVYNGNPLHEKSLPTYHWKKNPGRYSGLGAAEKWKNTQITFKTSDEFLLNHSMDSIAFSPNSSYEIPLRSENSFFNFKAGILPTTEKLSQAKGKLKIISDHKILKEIVFDKTENWENFTFRIHAKKNLKLEWISENSFLFMGAPVFLLPSSKKKYNIVFIVIDAVKKNATGFGGSSIPTTPNLDKLSLESVNFENAFVNANWTKPSMISMLYSDYSSSLGIGNIGFQVEEFRKKIFYSLKKKSIVEVLRDNGYYTAAIMNNVFFLDYTGVGVDLGFHEINQIGKEVKDTKKITDTSIEFIKNNKDKNFFLHINLNTPHTPYLPPKRILEAIEKESKNQFTKLNEYEKKYLGEIRYADEELGRFFASLKSEGLYDETFIIVTSDHGEILNEFHDSANHPNGGIRFGHGESLFDEELNVPYLIKLPVSIRSTAKIQKIKAQSSLLSFAPTLLGLANIDSQNNWVGQDYSKYILTGKEQPKEETIFSEGRLSESIRTESYKYVRRYPGYHSENQKRLSTKLEQLYDLKNDPDERKNIAIENQSLLHKARKEMEKFFIKRNRYIIHFPSCSCDYTGELTLKGGIYRVIESRNTHIDELNRKRISFTSKLKNSSEELIIETINPEFEFELNMKKDGLNTDYRIGKFGLTRGIDTRKSESQRLFASSQIPYGYEKSKDIWIYNDSQFFGASRSKDQSSVGDEVKNILKSWGYIHE